MFRVLDITNSLLLVSGDLILVFISWIFEMLLLLKDSFFLIKLTSSNGLGDFILVFVSLKFDISLLLVTGFLLVKITSSYIYMMIS